MSRRPSTSALWLGAVALALAGVGCGPQYRNAFSHHFLDNQETDLGLVLEQLPEASHDDAPENALGEPIAVATTHAESDAERQLLAYRVDTGEQMWSVTVDAATRPEILGDVVLTSTRERLIAYDLSSGRELWHYDLPDLAYVGATRDADTIYWSATVGALGGARRVGHVVAMNARSGAELWRHEVQGVFGQPAASGGLVFVPWERQNIAVLDEETGNELARLRSTDDVVAWAFDHPTGIYYGGRGIYRLTHRSVHGTRAEATHVRPPLGELPRQPESVWPDGFVPKPGTRSARGRIRVYFNPAPAESPDSIHVEGDTYYFAYYRYVFAYDLEGHLRWTRILEQDVINAEAMPHGLLTVGEQGQMHLLDRDTGNDRWTQDLEAELASVAIDAAGFQPGGETGETRPLRQTLNEMILDPDNRLVAARAYAVQKLAQIEEEEITRDLLDLYQQRSMPGALKEAIREALRTRRSGAQYLQEALARRYDYLEDTQAPPLEAIIPALLEMEHTEAVPRLINHMLDHETPAEVLPQVVDAVVRLGGEEAVPALRNFLVLYHADSQFQGPVADQEPEEEGGEPIRANPEARALAIASAGIFEHGGEEGRELLASLSGEDARTLEPVAEHIRGLYQAEREAEERRRREEEEAAQRALAEAARQAEEALPRRLSQEAINQTFAENADPVRECVAGELERNPRLNQVRMVFILSSDGEASELTVSPNTPELVECLRERVSAIEFPRFQQRRMRASFTVSIRGSESEAEDTQPAVAEVPEDAPWWTWSQRRAEMRGVGGELPALAWWAEREAPEEPEEPEEAVASTEVECPPGMPNCQQAQPRDAEGGSQASTDGGQQASAGGQTGGGQEGGQTGGGREGGQAGAGEEGGGQQGGGTPWWAAAASEEDEEDAEDDDEEE
ncbi:MAG TPA: PQQ-binding-like beta-propeller repeat protein [Sandaracinaceae bacterium LLY-WYZ-13_1]|nr:PQQ-binding-like beta-propeller repeat protein [Sandaracinaceae bacterium LLY-WYZ-13_1]